SSSRTSGSSRRRSITVASCARASTSSRGRHTRAAVAAPGADPAIAGGDDCPVVMRVESSIMTSLSELRAIEQQRIADERAARERQRLAEIEARRVAEQARIAAEQARLRAEREERLRIEEARIEA